MKSSPILLNDFQRIPEAVRQELADAARAVIDSGWYILGRHVTRFEKAWADYCGLPHAVGVANGMDAIEIGLRVLGIGPGHEVITTPLTAYATILGILRAGATPVLADINPDTGLLNIDSAQRCLSPSSRAILLVHLYGQVRNMSAWQRLCREHGIHLLEDCAQAHGAEYGGVKAGAFGTWGAYSFYPTKNLGAFGDGGALGLAKPELAAGAASLRNYGQADRYHHPVLGLNSRLDEMQAALLSVLLKGLPAATARRQTLASRYRSEIANPKIKLLAAPESVSSHVYHLFVVRCANRTALQEFLAAREIQTLIHYPVCAHHQPPTKDLARDPHGLKEAELFARDCLSIPCHPHMSDEEATRVIAALNAF